MNNTFQLIAKIHESYKLLSKSSPNGSEKLKTSFYVFLARLHSNLKLEISFKMKVKILVFFMKNPLAVPGVKPVNKYLDENAKELEYGKYMEDFVLGMIDHLKLSSTESEDYMEKLTSAVEISPFAALGCLLYMIKKDYHRCFEIYLNSKNKLYQVNK